MFDFRYIQGSPTRIWAINTWSGIEYIELGLFFAHNPVYLVHHLQETTAG